MQWRSPSAACWRPLLRRQKLIQHSQQLSDMPHDVRRLWRPTRQRRALRERENDMTQAPWWGTRSLMARSLLRSGCDGKLSTDTSDGQDAWNDTMDAWNTSTADPATAYPRSKRIAVTVRGSGHHQDGNVPGRKNFF